MRDPWRARKIHSRLSGDCFLSGVERDSLSRAAIARITGKSNCAPRTTSAKSRVWRAAQEVPPLPPIPCCE